MRICALFLLFSSCLSVVMAVETPSPQRSQRPAITQKMIANMIEALTDERERFHSRAIRALVRVGVRCIPDLRILSTDPNPALRLRVAVVTGQIQHAQASQLLVEMGVDARSEVREVVAIALGHHKTTASLQTLAHLIQDPEPEVRESAALGLGFYGDPRAIRLLAHSYVLQAVPVGALPVDERKILRAKSAAREALFALCRRASHIDDVATLLRSMNGEALHILIEASYGIGDPRLTMPLIDVLNRNVDVESHRLAVISLRANGDSRCLETLCRIAAGGLGPQEDSAATLAQLTGHRAAPGPVWALWWRNHKGAIARLLPRDEFIAALHNPAYTVNAQELQQFKVTDLQQIIDGILGAGADHWPALAWRALQHDDPARWTAHLLQAYTGEADDVKRIGLILLLAELADPAAIKPMREQYALVSKKLKAAAKSGQKHGSSERLALSLFADGTR